MMWCCGESIIKLNKIVISHYEKILLVNILGIWAQIQNKVKGIHSLNSCLKSFSLFYKLSCPTIWNTAVHLVQLHNTFSWSNKSNGFVRIINQ